MSRHRVVRLCAALVLVAAGLVSVPLGAQAAGETVVSLTFNDGLMSQYTNARPVLQAHNMTGTFYVSSKVIEANAPGYMATWHVDDLYRDGNEVGGLSKDHVDLTDSGTSTEFKTDQVCGDKNRLTQLGYDPRSFSYPFAAVNPAAESIVQGCGYSSGRTVGGLYAGFPANALPPADPFFISTVGSTASPVQLAELQDAVNVAASNGGGWVPIAFDQVCAASDPNYSSCMASYHPIDSGVLSSFLDWLQSGAPAGTQVKRVRDVMGAPAQPVLPPRPTVVSLTFDDGLDSQFKGVRNLFKDRRLHGTFYLNTGAIDAAEDDAMSWNQVRDLRDDGNDIGGHTLTHEDLTSGSTSFDFKWHQACDDRARLQAQGFAPLNFAYPFAAFNPTAASIVQGCGYNTGRTGGSLLVGGPIFSETVPPPETYTFKALGTTYDGPVTLQNMQDAVNGAAARAGGWIPMVFHDVCISGSPTFASCMAGYRPVSNTTLKSFMDWVLANGSRGISIKSVAEVLGQAGTPNVRITSPVAGGLTRPTPTISGTASASGGSVSVSIYAGPYSTGTPVATVTATSNAGTWTVPASLAPGTYTAQARQAAGGLTGVSSPVTFIATDDATGPAVQLTAPVNGAFVGDTSPLINGTAGTAPGDNSAVTVRIYNSTVTTGTPRQTLNTTATTGGTFSVKPGALPQGTFTAVASQSDVLGNTGTSQITFTVDTDKPTVRITSPANDTKVSALSFDVTGTAGTAAGDLAEVTITVSQGATVVRTVQSTAVGGTYTTTISGLPAATYTVRAGQADSAGNVGQSSNVKVVVVSSMKVSDVTPKDVSQGETGRILTFKGDGFTAGAVASFSGTGVTVTSTTIVGPKELAVSVTVAPGAELTKRDAFVSLPGTNDAVCTDCLTVKAARPP